MKGTQYALQQYMLTSGCLEIHQPLLHKTEATRLGSVHNSVKKKNLSSSTMTARLQCKKVTKASSDKRVKAAAESVAKVKDVIHRTQAASAALHLDNKPGF